MLQGVSEPDLMVALRLHASPHLTASRRWGLFSSHLQMANQGSETESHLPVATQLTGGVRIQISICLNLDPCLTLGLLRNNWILGPLFRNIKAQCSEEGRIFPPSKTALLWSPILGGLGTCPGGPQVPSCSWHVSTVFCFRGRPRGDHSQCIQSV